MLNASFSRPPRSCCAMARWILPILTGSLALACCGGCEAFQQRYEQQQKQQQESERQEQARKAMTTFLKSLPQAENQAGWALEQSTVFGPGIDGGSIQDDPDWTYAARIWCEGNTAEGQPVSLKRTIAMKMSQGQDAKWQVTDYKVAAEEPLSYWEQIGSCLLMGFLMPLAGIAVLFLGLFILASIAELLPWKDGLGCLWNICFIIPAITLIPPWIGGSFQCFGSWLESLFFVGIPWLILGFIVYQVRKALKSVPSSPSLRLR